MNVTNNKRKKESKEKIKKTFTELLQTKEINEINITELVKKAGINRSTFYVNYIDIYDLADKIKEEMFTDLLELYKEEAIKKKHSYDYLKLFAHIKENQIYYRTMLKLNFDFMNYYDNHLEESDMIKYYGTTKNMDYHIEFFKAGMTAIIKKWLLNNCKESPEEMIEIINSEYKGKSLEN